MELQNNPFQSPPDLRELVHLSGSRDEAESREAVRQLRLQRDEAVPFLIDMARRALQTSQTNQTTFLGFLVLIALILCIVGGSLFGSAGVAGSLLILALCTAVGATRWSFAPSHLQSAVRLLADSGDVRAVGVLTEALNTTNPAVRAYAKAGLIALLPSLTPEDATLLTPAQRQILRTYLSPYTGFGNVDLATAIIQAMTSIGDMEALPGVFMLASLPISDPYQKPAIAAAQRCLPQMIARLDAAHQFGDPKQIAQWIDKRAAALTTENGVIPQGYTAGIALSLLLPRLKTEDATQLDKSHRERLYSFLPTGAHILYVEPDMATAIIEFAKCIGDTAALPAVQRVAHADAPTANLQRIRAAARECLPILEALAEKEQVGQSLLRASNAPGVAPDTLLRPATAHSLESDPQQLLRATQAEGEKDQ